MWTFYFCSWRRPMWKSSDRLPLFLLLVVLSVRWKIRTLLCSRPQPENHIKNAAIWNRWVSKGLNSLNESSEPKKSQWFSGCIKEHSRVSNNEETFPQVYRVRRSGKDKIRVLPKAAVLNVAACQNHQGALGKQDAWALPQTNWTRNSWHHVFWKLPWRLWGLRVTAAF